jgi:hypothetical protein
MVRLMKELETQFTASAQLEREIRENLKGLGHVG